MHSVLRMHAHYNLLSNYRLTVTASSNHRYDIIPGTGLETAHVCTPIDTIQIMGVPSLFTPWEIEAGKGFP